MIALKSDGFPAPCSQARAPFPSFEDRFQDNDKSPDATQTVRWPCAQSCRRVDAKLLFSEAGIS